MPTRVPTDHVGRLVWQGRVAEGWQAAPRPDAETGTARPDPAPRFPRGAARG
jgi:hypothetical protein